MTDSLVRAYRQARYEVHTDRGVLAVRVGEASPALDALLKRKSAREGVFITAWNPRSEPRPAGANRAAHRSLVAQVRALGLRGLPHVGRGEDPGWREEGLFVLDLEAHAALELAERFAQNAVVRYPQGGPAGLLFTPLSGLAR